MSAPSSTPSDEPAATPDKPRIDLDWVRLVAGALAAVSSAFLLSTLGAVGTLAGAALGSVIASVSASLYSASLERSRQKVLEVQVPLRRRPAGDTTTLVVDTPADEIVEPVEPVDPRSMPTVTIPVIASTPEPATEPAPAAAPASSGEDGRAGSLLAAVPWKKVALWAAGLFVAAMLVLTVIEGIVGKSASDITGGSDGGSRTSFGQLVGGGSGGSGDTEQRDPSPQPTTEGTGTDAPGSEGSSIPTSEPTTDGPTSEPTTGGPTSGTTSAPTGGATPTAPTAPPSSAAPGAAGTAGP